MFKTSLVTTIALALAFGTAAGGTATADQFETFSRTVRFSDLDLAKERDARTLLRRIRSAADYVCSGGLGARDPAAHLDRHYRACFRKATDQAVIDVGNPMVSSLYGAPGVRMAQK